jgi:hypothetical protein
MMRGVALALVLLAAAAQAQQPQPQPQPAPVPVLRLDDQAIRDAVKATVAEMPRLPPANAKPDFGGSGTAPGGSLSSQEQIDRAFSDAVVESCWGSGALKHTPPVISVGGLPIMLGGLLTLPHLFYAATNGRCK